MEAFEQAKEAIIASAQDSSVYVGCDSIRFKRDGKWFARYSTVIVVHLNSSRGCKLYHNTETIPDYGSIKQRLLNEVMYAMAAATEIIDHIGDRHLEIHLDINSNPKHKSNIALKEALGYVRGTFGFDPIFKPNAWCATHCSDHVVRHMH